MEITLTPWQLTGIVIAAVVGIITIFSVLVAAGFRVGKLVTRDDLNRTSDQLEKKIEDEVGRLEKKIGDEVGRLEKKIGDEVGRLERKIGDEVGRLERKIDESDERLNRRIDEVLLAIQNLGVRLENAIMEHTHDEDGTAVFRRHPQMADADD